MNEKLTTGPDDVEDARGGVVERLGYLLARDWLERQYKTTGAGGGNGSPYCVEPKPECRKGNADP